MSIGTDVIKGALRKIGAHSIVSPAEPGTIIETMETLNSMILEWISQDIELGITPLEAPSDDLDEPPGTRNIIEDNLAIAAAPNFDNGSTTVVSAALQRNARLGFGRLEVAYQAVSVPKKKVSGTLPRGAGNSRGNWEDTFFGKSRDLDG